MTSTEQNKATVRDFIDGLFTKGDLGAVDTYLAEDFINHDPSFGVSADREGLRAAAAMLRTAFPDWHSEMHQFVAEGDLVVERFTASGTQVGEVMGVAPTGREVSLPGINIFRLRDGLIVETPAQLGSLLLDVHGLTPAQQRVIGLVLQGFSTRQIVDRLHLSPHTIQEHVRAAFDKVGVGSRRELIAALLSQP